MRTIRSVACALALCIGQAVAVGTDGAQPQDAQPAATQDAAASTPRRGIMAGETTLRKTDGSVDAVYRYRIVEPLPDAVAKAGGKVPLIVFLHGSGERGDDNAAQLKHFVGWTATEQFQSKAPCFVLALQCPAGESWTNFDLKAFTERGEYPRLAKEPTRALKAVMQATDEIVATKPIDRDRIYLTGLSMGGFGVFDLVARRPEFFAAAVPICGGGDPSTASILANTRFHIVHSNYDPVVPNELSRTMSREIGLASQKAWQDARAQALSAKPPKPIPPRIRNPAYREYDGVGHESWTPAYRFGEDGVLDWMFDKRRTAGTTDATSAAPGTPAQPTTGAPAKP
jgi:predicted peptidase